MTLVVKTFTFAADAEGFTDHGDSANVTFSFVAGDGSPSSGCVKFAQTAFSAPGTERARSAAGHDWTYWGVPAGVNVTAVQVTAYKSKSALGSHDSPPVVTAEIISGETLVHSAGDLFRCETHSTTWAAQTTGTERAVDSAFQAAATAVQMQLSFTGFGGQTAYLDTIELTITHDGGASDFSDSVTAKGAGRSAETEVLAGQDTVLALGAGRSATVEHMTAGETLNAIGAGLSATTDAGVNALSAVMAGLSATVDGPQAFRDTLSAVMGGLSVISDEVPSFTPRVYADYLNARMGGLSVTAEVERGRDTLLAAAAGKSAIVGNVQAGSDALSAVGAGMGAIIRDALAHADTLNARMAGRSAGSERAKLKQTTNAVAAGKAAGVEVIHAVSVLNAKGAGRSAATEALHAAQTLNARMAGKAATVSHLTAAHTVNAVMAGKAASVFVHRSFRDTLNAKGAGLSSLLEQRRMRDTLNARMAGASAVALSVAGPSADTLHAVMAGKSQAVETSAFTVDDLIRTLRAIAHATLSELKSVPEGMTEGQFSADLPLPYLLIVALEPHEDETAVMSFAQIVPVDLVFIADNKAGRDNPQYARSRLNLLADAYARDYHLGRGTGAAVANDTNITATPYNRLNQYQQMVSEAAQGATAMALTIECRLVFDIRRA